MPATLPVFIASDAIPSIAEDQLGPSVLDSQPTNKSERTNKFFNLKLFTMLFPLFHLIMGNSR